MANIPQNAIAVIRSISVPISTATATGSSASSIGSSNAVALQRATTSWLPTTLPSYSLPRSGYGFALMSPRPRSMASSASLIMLSFRIVSMLLLWMSDAIVTRLTRDWAGVLVPPPGGAEWLRWRSRLWRAPGCRRARMALGPGSRMRSVETSHDVLDRRQWRWLSQWVCRSRGRSVRTLRHHAERLAPQAGAVKQVWDVAATEAMSVFRNPERGAN